MVQFVPGAPRGDLGDAQSGRVSQAEAHALVGSQQLRNRTDPPTPLGMDSLTYPPFAASGK